MIVLYSALILLMPLVPLILLFNASSEIRRRAWLLSLCLFLFINGIWYLCIRWIVFKTEEIKSALSLPNVNMPPLFEGRGATIMASFFSDARLIIVYALSIVIAGHFANQHAIRRINNKNL